MVILKSSKESSFRAYWYLGLAEQAQRFLTINHSVLCKLGIYPLVISRMIGDLNREHLNTPAAHSCSVKSKAHSSSK